MKKKQIKVTITKTGELKFDNTGNPGTEQQILAELAELAELLTGDPTDFTVEKHVHTHAHGTAHTDDHVYG